MRATSTVPAPRWARVLRQVAIWGGAGTLAVGTYVGATIAQREFLEEQSETQGPENRLATAADELGDELVYVQPEAEGVLDAPSLAALEDQAADAALPTRVVIWPLDGGWLPDVAEHLAARSNLESRFLLVNEDGQTGTASTLEESEPSIASTDGMPPAAAAAQALTDLEATPLVGEREKYDDGGQPIGSTWLAAAVGGGLGLAILLVAVGGAFVVFGAVLLPVLFGLLAIETYRRRKAGPAIADIEARPARPRGKNRLAYRPPNDVLVRLNKVGAAERAERLRSELLDLGERMAASTDDAAGEAWALALDCYATAGRIADASEAGTDVTSHADVVAGLVLVARGRRAVDAAEAGRELAESTDCFANPFHGASAGTVPTIALGSERPPDSVPQQVEVCATCRAAAKKGVAVADPLVLDAGRGRMRAYWMLEVKPWAEIGYGASSRVLINAWNSPRV